MLRSRCSRTLFGAWPRTSYSTQTLSSRMSSAVIFASRFFEPWMQRPVQDAHGEIDKEQQQRYPNYVRDDHVHSHVAAQQRDAERKAVLRGYHFAGKQEQHHRFQVEANAVQNAWQDLFHDNPVSHAEIPRAKSKALDDLLIGNALCEVEGVENDGGGDADHDQHDLRQFIDTEGDEEDREHGERDDLVEEENEAEKELPDDGEQTHVEPEDDGGDEQKHA